MAIAVQNDYRHSCLSVFLYCGYELLNSSYEILLAVQNLVYVGVVESCDIIIRRSLTSAVVHHLFVEIEEIVGIKREYAVLFERSLDSSGNEPNVRLIARYAEDYE